MFQMVAALLNNLLLALGTNKQLNQTLPRPQADVRRALLFEHSRHWPGGEANGHPEAPFMEVDVRGLFQRLNLQENLQEMAPKQPN